MRKQQGKGTFYLLPMSRMAYEVSLWCAVTSCMNTPTTLTQIRTNHDDDVRKQDLAFYDTVVMTLLADPMVVPLSSIKELDRISAKYDLTGGII